MHTSSFGVLCTVVAVVEMPKPLEDAPCDHRPGPAQFLTSGQELWPDLCFVPACWWCW